jgi:hypothetical protein
MATLMAGPAAPSRRDRSTAFWIAMAACAAWLGASSVGSRPKAPMTPVGLRPSIRPPKLWILSSNSSMTRPVSSSTSGTEAAISDARSSVTRRRSHRSGVSVGAGTVDAGTGAGARLDVERGALGAARRTGAGAEGAGASPDLSPYFSIRARRVLREIPSTAAVREMFQLVWRRTSTTRSRTASSSELAPPDATPGAGAGGSAVTASVRPSTSAVTSGSLDSSATRSIRLASSRTLPGHGYARRAARASGESVLFDTP